MRKEHFQSGDFQRIYMKKKIRLNNIVGEKVDLDINLALQKLEKLIDKDLVPFAYKYNISLSDKGWAGKTVQMLLGLPSNSSRKPDFGSWELKTVSLKNPNNPSFKETMAITMVNLSDIASNRFEESHVYAKLDPVVIVARMYYNTPESRSEVFGVTRFDLRDDYFYDKIKSDYEFIQNEIKGKDFDSIHTINGEFIQIRTKGSRDSNTMAFYARVSFLNKFILPRFFVKRHKSIDDYF